MSFTNNSNISISLQNKATILVCVLSFLIASIVGGYNFFILSDIVEELALEKLSSDTRVTAVKFDDELNRLSEDLYTVSRMPPIKGIIRATKAGGIDPLDGSTMQLWQNRLQQIFKSMMEVNLHYSQMRYIAADGQELVRVNNSKGDLEAVDNDQLQNKKGEPYMADLESTPESVYFSDITYNSENGQVDSLSLMLRGILKIKDHENKLFGLLVINVDYPLMLSNILHQLELEHHTYVVNNFEDYAELNPDSIEYRFEYHGNYTKPIPAFMKLVDGKRNSTNTIVQDDVIASYSRLTLNFKNDSGFLAIFQTALKSEVMHTADVVKYRNLWVGFLLILISTLVSLWAFYQLFTPLRTMIKNLRGYNYHNIEALQLPAESMDEIGELAKVLENLIVSLHDQEAESSAVLECASDGIITINKKGEILKFNQASSEIFGFEMEEVIGKNISVLMPEPDHSLHDNYLSNFLRTGEKQIIGKGREVMGLRKDGSVFPMDLSVNVAEIKDTKIFTGIIRDISSRKEAERETLNLIESLRKSNEELEVFSRVLAHDVNSPVSAIRSLIDALEVTVHSGDTSDVGQILQMMKDSTEFVNNLIDELSLFNSLGLKNEPVENKVLNLSQVLDKVKSNLIAEISKSNAQISFGELPDIKCNETFLIQLFQNLISNAIKYSKSSINIKIYTLNHEKGLVFVVEDNGIGIPEDSLNSIFEPFKRHHRGTYSGTGLGLATCKKIVDYYQGDIWCESIVGEGTMFKFTLTDCII